MTETRVTSGHAGKDVRTGADPQGSSQSGEARAKVPVKKRVNAATFKTGKSQALSTRPNAGMGAQAGTGKFDSVSRADIKIKRG